jgi:putative flippase GtrA
MSTICLTLACAVYAPTVGHFSKIRREIARFGTVGAFAYVIDVGSFNLLQQEGFSPIADKPITAKIVSSVLATLFAYAGNRYWAFAHRDMGSHRQSLTLFFGFNVIGMGIASLCLAFSHYVLGMTSALANNISANLIGTGLATLFRFWAYRRFIFTDAPQLVQD